MASNAFHEGGWGMYPTTVFGILMILASLVYAIRPERRFVPLQISLGIMTIFAGSLGFVTGLIRSLDGLPDVDAAHRWIWLKGLGESLNDVGLAMAIIVLASLLASVGALRIALGAKSGGETVARVVAGAK